MLDHLGLTTKDVAEVVVAVILALLSARNGRKIQDVHISLNSRLDELLVAAKAASFEEGREAQRKQP